MRLHDLATRSSASCIPCSLARNFGMQPLTRRSPARTAFGSSSTRPSNSLRKSLPARSPGGARTGLGFERARALRWEVAAHADWLGSESGPSDKIGDFPGDAARPNRELGETGHLREMLEGAVESTRCDHGTARTCMP